MLAKQAWRLIHNNWSLFYRVYKARYSPNTSFLDAELGNNPSFVWRSLLAARDIIHTGSRWTIGDGRNVSVASHSWLPHSPVFLNTPSQDMKVIDLIDKDTWQWDRGKLFATYDRRTCESILALPLTHQNSHDKLIWKENRSQRFTVRSAYQVALRLKYPNQAEHSSVQAHGSTWRKLWKLNVPPKVRTFLWRACSGSKKDGSESKKDASCAITIARQLAMTSGLCLEVQSRSAAMKRTTFFSCSKCCSRSCVHLTWRKGQSRLGRFGMPGIGSTLSRYRHTRSIFLTAQWFYWKKRISTPKCSAYSVPRKEYFCQFCFSWDITVFI